MTTLTATTTSAACHTETVANRRARSRGLSRPERIALVILAVVLAICALVSRANTPRVTETTRVSVSSGDTLWAIAAANRLPGRSTAETAEYIARINRLETSVLLPGVELEVPASGLDADRMASR